MYYTIHIFHMNDRYIYVNCENHFIWRYDVVEKSEVLLVIKTLGYDNNFIWNFVKEHKHINGKFTIHDKKLLATESVDIDTNVIENIAIRYESLARYHDINIYIRSEFHNNLYYNNEKIDNYYFTNKRNLRLVMGDTNKFIKFDELIEPSFKNNFEVRPILKLSIIKLTNFDDKLSVLLGYIKHGIVKYKGYLVNSVEFTKTKIIISADIKYEVYDINDFYDGITLERLN